MGTYYHDKEKKIIVINPPMRKYKNGIKVYFYRGETHSEEPADYPVCYADTPKGKYVNWDFDFVILGVNVKRPKLFGFLGSYWEALEESKIPNN